MPDIKAGYDYVILSALGLLAAGVMFWLAASATDARERAATPATATKGESFANDPAVETLKADKAELANRRQWREGKSSPFVSRVYLLKDDRLVDILESGNELFQGIPNGWILEHGLDYMDAGLPDRDPDEDGFTNGEEFAAKTNPRDKSSQPEEWTKLRLAEFQNEQMQTIFTGKDDQGRALINSVAATSGDLRGKTIGPTKAYAPGETIMVAKYKTGFSVTYDEEKTPFKLKEFRTEKRPNTRITNPDGTPQMDEIEIALLESGEADGTTVALEARKPVTSPYSLAILQDTRPGGGSQQVRAGQTFTIGQSKYKLVDVSEESATIEDASKQQHSVPRGSAANPAPSTTPELEPPQ